MTSIADLRRFHRPGSWPTWHACVVQPEMNGGRTTVRDLDALDSAGPWSVLTISGLDQDTFEALVDRFGARVTALHLWKCPRIADLGPLEGLERLAHLAMFWNQRATRLWNLRRTPALRGLYFTDFVKLDQLDDLAMGSGSLRTLEFGNATVSRSVVRTLEPLVNLPDLTSLAFNAKTIGDGRIQPLARLQKLDELAFPANQFSVDQLAWLRTKLPATLDCDALAPMRRLGQPLRRGARQLDLLVNGKRGPFLSSADEALRVEACAAAFRSRVEHFAAHPTAEPDAAKA